MDNAIRLLSALVIFGTQSAESKIAPVVIDRDVVLSSVYDAIRGNSVIPPPSIDIDEEVRNKRNVRYYTYEDAKGEEYLPSYGEVVHPTQAQPQCKSDPSSAAVQSISISDHSWGSIGHSIIHVLKYLIAGLALLTLPVLLLQAFILPLKILMGLKTVAVANSLVLGTFLWKYLHRHRNSAPDDDDDEDEEEETAGSNGGEATAGGNGSNSINRFYPFRAEDFQNMTEDEIKTALKLLTTRNKNW